MATFPLEHFLPVAQPFLTPAALVNEGSVLGIPAFDACVSKLAGNVSQMTPLLMDDGSTPPELVTRPNPFYTTSEFWYEAVATLITWGNYFARIYRDPDTDLATALIPLHPKLIVVAGDPKTGRYTWQVNGEFIKEEDLFHVRFKTVPNRKLGISVIEQHARLFGLALDGMQASSIAFRGSGVPSVVLTTKSDLSREQAKELLQGWKDAYANGSGTPAVLPESIAIEQLKGHSAQNMEALANRAHNEAEICMILGLRPSDIGLSFGANSGDMTYQNLNDARMSRYLDAVAPLTRRFEEALADLLPGNGTPRFNKSLLTDLDVQGKATVLQSLISSGIELAEARTIVGL